MEGKTLWVQADDVDGPLDAGQVVKATRPLNDWCLRGDDGSEPVAAGSLLEVIETRPWGAAMACELPAMQPVDVSPATIMQAALDLQDMGLWEFETETRPEMTPSGDIETVERAVRAVR
ncbi:MAG: hypothetical protein OXE53_00165 [Deltaproteobacteria bacterium]|nr:hypothetical protein [Deltaproteobacteria bacterium]